MLEILALVICLITIAAFVSTAVVSRMDRSLRPATGYLIGGVAGSVFGLAIAYWGVKTAGNIPLLLIERGITSESLNTMFSELSWAIRRFGPLLTWPLAVVTGFAAGVCMGFRWRLKGNDSSGDAEGWD